MSKPNLRVTAMILVLILLPLLAFSQPPDETKSHGLPNGNYYLALDVRGKRTFLSGIENGITLLADEGGISHTVARNYLAGDLGGLANQIGRFYADKANLRIPIGYAYLYAIRISRGDPPMELKNFLAELRKRFPQR